MSERAGPGRAEVVIGADGGGRLRETVGFARAVVLVRLPAVERMVGDDPAEAAVVTLDGDRLGAAGAVVVGVLDQVVDGYDVHVAGAHTRPGLIDRKA